MAINRTLPLDERIKNDQADIEAYIAAKVEALRKECPGVPGGSIRNTLVRGGCLCVTYARLKAQDDEAAAREKAA